MGQSSSSQPLKPRWLIFLQIARQDRKNGKANPTWFAAFFSGTRQISVANHTEHRKRENRTTQPTKSLISPLKSHRFLQNRRKIDPRCVVDQIKVSPFSLTCRLMSVFQSVTHYGEPGSCRIRPSINSIQRSAICTSQKAGPRCRRYSHCWFRCCRRSTASVRNDCFSTSSITPPHSAGLQG